MLAIGRESDGENSVFMRGRNCPQELAAGDAPELELRRAGWNAASGNEHLAVGAEVESENAINEQFRMIQSADGPFELPGTRCTVDNRPLVGRDREKSFI